MVDKLLNRINRAGYLLQIVETEIDEYVKSQYQELYDMEKRRIEEIKKLLG